MLAQGLAAGSAGSLRGVGVREHEADSVRLQGVGELAACLSRGKSEVHHCR